MTNNADTPNMLKNKENFNISEGNVKKDNTFCKKNVANNVAQANSQDLERVADTSKTIDHIVELIHWESVAKDVEFENHILKLKQMKQFNEGR